MSEPVQMGQSDGPATRRRPMTMAEKILAAHAGLDEVSPGQLVECDIDIVLANDITAPLAIRAFEATGAGRVFDRTRIVLVPDHYVPNKDIMSAEQARLVRTFAHEQGITHYFEVGCGGIEHALLPEQGIVGPGDLVIGADSHTCTYGALGAFATGVGSTDAGVAFATGKAWFKVPSTIRFVIEGELPGYVSAKDVILHIIGMTGVDGALYQAMEFSGSAVRGLSMESRLTIANMAVEAGAKAGLFEVDDITDEYVAGRAERPWVCHSPDEDAEYARTVHIDACDIRPLVAFPHLPSNVHPLDEARGIAIDEVVIGSCTNGRYEDLKQAADVLRGNHVAPGIRCIILPATRDVHRRAAREGLVEVFLDAGCVVSTPTCGPCLGGHMGVLAAGERAVSTTNRNFVGRMGDPTSEVYLASPAIAAASAICGHIAGPSDVATATRLATSPLPGDAETPSGAGEGV